MRSSRDEKDPLTHAVLQTTPNWEAAISRIASAQRRRLAGLGLAHLLPLAVLLAGHGWAALAVLMGVHAVMLWGTLCPQSRLFGGIVRCLATREQIVWLTIDDGPSKDTPAILQLLARYDAHATFFLVAERARRQPAHVRAIIDGGHEIGNHSCTHPSAVFWALPPRRMRREIVRAQQILSAFGGHPVRWFRAVAGHANPFVAPALRVLALQRVGWSVRAYDAVDGNAGRVSGKLLRAIEPGAVVLLHEGAAHGNSVAIIEAFLQGLERAGYRAQLPPSVQR